MGLFSKFKRKPAGTAFDLSYNVRDLEKSIVSLAPQLADFKSEAGSRIYTSYISKLLNLEILKLSTGKELNSEAYAYRRGRIDAVRELIARRETYILDDQNAKSIAKESKSGAEHKSKRSFLKKPTPSSAGLSI